MKRLLFLLMLLPLALAWAADDEAVFPIGGYAGDIESYRNTAFSLLGPVYRHQERQLQLAEELNLPCVYRIGVAVDFHGKHGPPVKTLNREKIRAEIEAQVKAVADNPYIKIWYLTPEELRYWRKAELEYLQLASETIRATDPLKRPVWMYEPGHRTRMALEKTLPCQQIAGKGLYTNYSGRKNERIWVRWTLGQQQAAIHAVNPEAVPYAIPEMFQEPLPEEQEMIPVWVRHDAYAAMVSDVKGMIIFSFSRRKGFKSRSRYLQEYARFANEMNGPLKLGSVFLKGKPLPAPSFEVIEGEPETQLTGGSSGPKETITLPSVACKAYEWRNYVYLFVVNSSPAPVTLRFEQPHSWTPLLEGQPAMEEDRLKLAGYGVGAFKRPVTP